MDSLTQIVLGGALAAAIAPPPHRRAALLAGAGLGTLVLLPLGLDPVHSMTWHRGPSHSLFVQIPLAALMWAAFRRMGGRVAESPVRWFWAIQLALVTHPLLDALTVYGTPLLVACVLAWRWRERVGAQRALAIGLALSPAYLGWTLTPCRDCSGSTTGS